MNYIFEICWYIIGIKFYMVGCDSFDSEFCCVFVGKYVLIWLFYIRIRYLMGYLLWSICLGFLLKMK